ncbi:MAG: 2-oxo acid dehydrogenase subunit E2 [Pseudomonadota bacterium]|nr:branched-chain alpha-keto acid dehydrogenase subunit E2 [Gammaproteobacteria bacterium]MEE2684561.1 2-oxo acid dehydrogenase subunit E2 [Pseudomonadota bacterium]|tara:strand:- start:1346 stop:2614 length:1269 start_codon:yes stop_codon:yes gene_type:complete
MNLLVPDIGDFKDVDVIEILVNVGDKIEVDDPLIVLETDKATMDIPSTHSGVIEKILVDKGKKVIKGDIICVIEAELQEPIEQESIKKLPQKEEVVSTNDLPLEQESDNLNNSKEANNQIDNASFKSAHASPSVRKFARELGADLARISGTASKGRITTDDVKAYVKKILRGSHSQLPEIAIPDFSSYGRIEKIKLTKIQKISGPRLHASWVNLPHVTQNDEIDITDIDKKRNSLKKTALDKGFSLTILPFVIKACSISLKKYPKFSSSLSEDGSELIFKKYCNIGFAVDTPDGLVVPVIKNVDKKNIFDIAIELSRLSDLARSNKLGLEDMQGGVFTVSSLGGIGGTSFTPIINAPEVAILGISKNFYKPIYKNDNFTPRLVLPISLSYDHRVIDGADGVRFTTFLSSAMKELELTKDIGE